MFKIDQRYQMVCFLSCNSTTNKLIQSLFLTVLWHSDQDFYSRNPNPHFNLPSDLSIHVAQFTSLKKIPLCPSCASSTWNGKHWVLTLLRATKILWWKWSWQFCQGCEKQNQIRLISAEMSWLYGAEDSKSKFGG